MSYIFHTT
jgi:hypothetical protein